MSELRALTVRDNAGKPIGVLEAAANQGWLAVKRLWVAQHARSSGLEAKLIEEAHARAAKAGFIGAYLDTFGQARGFYEKLGYRVAGTLPDDPKSLGRYFMQKVF